MNLFADLIASSSASRQTGEGPRIQKRRGVEIKSAELIMFPSNTIDLDSKTAMSVLRLLDKLEELDDVQKVFSNANFSDDILNEYSNSN